LKFNLSSFPSETKIPKGDILHNKEDSIPEFNTIEVDVLLIKNKQEISLISQGLTFNADFYNLQKNLEIVSILGEYDGQNNFNLDKSDLVKKKFIKISENKRVKIILQNKSESPISRKKFEEDQRLGMLTINCEK
jgi:hypothetical protein